jgi:hypothetical protein
MHGGFLIIEVSFLDFVSVITIMKNQGGKMKKCLLIGLLSLCLILSCGAPEEQSKTEKPSTAKPEGVAYEKLTEAEIQKFMKVFPTARAEIEKSGKKFDAQVEPQNYEAWVAQFASSCKEIAGLDTKLKSAGMAWDEFWAAFMKIALAGVAHTVHEEMKDIEKGFAEVEAQLKNPKIPEAQKKMLEAQVEMMKEIKKIYKKVPQANRELVAKYWDQLDKIME